MLVLVADDEDLIRKILTKLLVKRGHEVLAASNGGEALAFLRSRQDIHLAILDQHMPGLTGLEVIAELRSFLPRLPVVLSSGDAELSVEDRYVNLLHKPYAMRTLEALIAGHGG